MNIRDHAQELLQQIAEELPPDALESALAFDDNDECFIALGDDLLVTLLLDEEIRALTLTLPVRPLPEDETRETVLLELMQGNYSWSLTEGGTLGVDRESGLICLSYLVPLPLAEPAQMPQIVNKLVSVVLHWRREIAELTALADGGLDLVSEQLLRA